MIKAIMNYLSDWREENPEERAFIILTSEGVDEFKANLNAAVEGSYNEIMNLLIESLKQPAFEALVMQALMSKSMQMQ